VARTPVFLAVTALALVPGGRAAERAADPSPRGVPVARAAIVLGKVEHALVKQPWREVKPNDRLVTGDRVRTQPGAQARLDFPWTSIALGGASEFAIAASRVLSTLLESGRAEVISDQAGMIKLLTPDARVEGSGRVVVKRDARGTWVMGFEGHQTVRAAGVSVRITEGEGTRIEPGKAPQPARPLPAPPRAMGPLTDPVYVRQGTPARVEWRGESAAYRVEILGLDGRDVLMARDAAASPASVEVPWLGTFRWRVRGLDPQGFEGIPSETGLLCIVEK
jgi:hypothetical protein